MIVQDATPIWTEMVNEYSKKGILPEFLKDYPKFMERRPKSLSLNKRAIDGKKKGQ